MAAGQGRAGQVNGGPESVAVYLYHGTLLPTHPFTCMPNPASSVVLLFQEILFMGQATLEVLEGTVLVDG